MEENENSLETMTNALETAITGIPAPVRKNFGKAVASLCTAAVSIPVAYLEGKAAEIKALSDARLDIIKKQGHNIAAGMEASTEYSYFASAKYAGKILKQQINLDKITLNAANELISNQKLNEANEIIEEISDDWLAEFENIAKIKSSEEMALVFGKILSGEIVKPGTFSIKTLKIVSELDSNSAKTFQIMCNNSIFVMAGDEIFDAKICCMDGQPDQNSLREFGLSYYELILLMEHGLITQNFNTSMDYVATILDDNNKFKFPFNFNGRKYCFRTNDGRPKPQSFKILGPTFTKSAKELLTVMKKEATAEYQTALNSYFNSKNLTLVPIT